MSLFVIVTNDAQRTRRRRSPLANIEEDPGIVRILQKRDVRVTDEQSRHDASEDWC